MPLSPDRFIENLHECALGSLYFVHGEEPLQVIECVDALRGAASRAGIGERVRFDLETGFDWDAVLSESKALSLFAERRLIEIRLGNRKPDKRGSAILRQLNAVGVGQDIILISAGKLDAGARSTKWFKHLDQTAISVQARSLNAAALPRWLMRRAGNVGKQLTRAAAEIIAIRVEGNMLAAAQEIEKLCLLVEAESIAETDIVNAVTDSARFDVFQLVDAALGAGLRRVIRIARGLREEGTEAVVVNWALARELRQLATMAARAGAGENIERVFDDYRVWKSRRGLLRATLRRFTADDLCALLEYANFIDTLIKGARTGSPWDAIEILLVSLSGDCRFRPLMASNMRERN